MKKRTKKAKRTTKLNFERATKRYNDLMWMVGHEHMAVNEPLSELKDQWTTEWSLVNMVEEVEYVLSCYYEEGHMFCDQQYEDEDGLKLWRSETGKLKRFINAYKPFIEKGENPAVVLK